LRGGLYTVFTSSDSHERSGLFIGSDGTFGGSGDYYNITNGIKLGSYNAGGSLGCGVFLDGVNVLRITTTVSHLGKLMQVLWLPESNYLAIYLDGVLDRSYTNPVLGDSRLGGFCGVWHGHGSTSAPTKFSNIQFIAASPDATNGIAACIPPIGGGARYGEQEEVYFNIQNAVKHGEYAALLCAKSTTPSVIEMTTQNITDSTSIRPDRVISEEVATTENYNNHVVHTVTKYQDRNDIIEVSVKNKNASNIYVETLAITPIYEVI
jgi:hypothetical protein